MRRNQSAQHENSPGIAHHPAEAVRRPSSSDAAGHSVAAARLRAAWSRSITARQPGLTCARSLTMQAVILWTLGTSWPHSRRASPVHICCASDEKAGPGRAESAVAAEAMAMRSAILLVRWKVIDAFPKVARGAGRYSSGALHAACAAARVIHHREVTRCGCSISADVESKVLRRPVANYAPMLRSCNGLRQHFPKLLRARHVERSERCATTRF